MKKARGKGRRIERGHVGDGVVQAVAAEGARGEQ